MLEERQIVPLRPFGQTLHHSLLNARIDSKGWAVWEEEDYCSPPLKMERAAVLDTFFTDLGVSAVKENEGWQQIKSLPGLWGQNT